MKGEAIDELIKLYKEGKTSREEEILLSKYLNAHHLENRDVRALLAYVNEKKEKSPKRLNDKLWNDFEQKTRPGKQKNFWIWSAVASVLILISFYLNWNSRSHFEEREKEIVLEMARRLFQETEEVLPIERILFEDETMIVYVETEN